MAAWRWLFGTLLLVYVIVGVSACALQDKFVYFVDPEPARLPDGLPIIAREVVTDDGESLVAWSIAAQPGCPTMLMFHGNAGHLAQGRWQYQRIADAGVGMLAVSWRGYAGSSGRPSEAGLYADADASYRALRAAGVEPDDLVIHGFSLGSGPAVKLASEQAAGALVLEAPFLSARKLAEEAFFFLPVGLVFKHNFRSDRFISDVDEPILIVHGGADSVIPARHSERLAALASGDVTRRVFQDSDHNTLVRDGLYENAVWPFLATRYPDCPFKSESEGSVSQ